MTRATTASPWLAGNYAPVHDELDVADLPVTGALPDRLEGAFLRNGANPAYPPPGHYHPFDGDGMIHGLYLDGGRASYRNRWVRSRGLAAERRAGKALYGGLADLQVPDAATVADAGPIKNTANTHVVRHGGRIFALMEACPPTEITWDLATIGEHDFGGQLAGAMSAHPRIDPVTGDMVFFGYSPLPPYLRLYAADPAGTITWSTAVDLPAPVMMHDFVITDRHAVLFDLPAIFDLDAALSGQGDIVRWDPGHGARIGVLELGASGETVRWFDVEPFWAFHFLNAAADAGTGRITVEGCRASRLNVAFGDEELTDPVRPHLHRWIIDLGTGQVTDEPLDDRPVDFPRLDERRTGRPVRYGYAAWTRRWDETTAEFAGVVKYDLRTGTSDRLELAPAVAGGEWVFAPDPASAGPGAGEDAPGDAGWLLGFVHDQEVGESAVLVVDAGDLAEVARVHLPRRVPFGFHGAWLPTGGSAAWPS